MKPQAADYLEIEAALQTRLLKAWRPVGAALYKKLIPLLTDGKFSAAITLADTINLGPIAQANREYIKAMLWKSAEFGAKQAANDHLTAFSVGNYTALLNHVADLFVASFVLNATTQVHDSVLQSIAELESAEKLAKKDDKKQRFVKDFVSFNDDGDSMVKLVSSLHTSRLAVWGFTAEAEVRGIATYKLSAVLDNRTSEFCRFIDGHTFDVATARGRVTRSLAATNPDDLKVLAPWPDQSKAGMQAIRGMSSEELEAAGYSVPPFHPHCRTICVLTTFKETVPAATPEAPVVGGVHNATPEEFDELGVKATPTQVDYWNRHFQDGPVDTLSKVFDTDAENIIDETGNLVKFDEDGSVVLKAKKEFEELRSGLDKELDAEEEDEHNDELYKKVLEEFHNELQDDDRDTISGNVSSSMAFDILKKRIELGYVNFNDVAPEEAATYLENMISESASIGKSNGMDALTLTATGIMGAYAYAKLGFVPETNDWKVLSTEIQGELTDLDLPPTVETAVEKVLESNDPKSIWVIAGMDYPVDGVPLGQVLLKDKQYKGELDFTDVHAMGLFGAVP